ncbi:MAG: efflux RND transporter permease subunit [Gammaproteobacteria bacterium]|nr:efflux RND transporter permease subunit [Gammaproteobacteria bacterium]
MQNHVLANLLFALVIVVGTASYLLMPRQQDPTINFNWIDITTIFPGASATDVEARVTDVLEEAVRNVSDIDFVSSNSREGVSSILVRFEDIGEREFDQRVTNLRREIQNKDDELPDEVEDPYIFEVTSANAFPTATVVVTGPADDEPLRYQSELAMKDIERIDGVDRILDTALRQPELQVLFDPVELMRHRMAPTELVDTVAAHYRDLSAGRAEIGDENWLVRLVGTNRDPGHLASLPVTTARGEVPIGALAAVERGREDPRQLVRFNGEPAVILAATKKGDANVLNVVERIRSYIDERNRELEGTGIRLVLADDQTEVTNNAISVMQTNALLGLILVLFVTWLFVGSRIALLTCIGIPFILAGTFWILREAGQTLNTSVLLGVVISLGMLVDDAVVVVEAIYYRLQRGAEVLEATRRALQEVAAPVTTAVLTTMSAFLPLMLLPGILGKFMLVIPLVVTVALAISLVEAYWMLPAHVIAARVGFDRPSRIHRYRVSALHWIRLRYTRLLLKVMRRPTIALLVILALFVGAVTASATSIRFDFFASDPIRLFYVNVHMPTGTPLDKTMATVREVEERARRHIEDAETRSIVSYAGQMFTETAPFFGDHYGQILVSLQPKSPELRSVDELIGALRGDVTSTPGPERVTILRLAGGPPTAKPISVKVRGDDLDRIRAAADELKTFLNGHEFITDVADDSPPGQREYSLRMDTDAVRKAGIPPSTVARTVGLLVDGEVAATMQDRGEEVALRIRARRDAYQSPDQLLRFALPAESGALVPLETLLKADKARGPANIRHFNFRRAITVEADIDAARIDTVAANRALLKHWESIRDQYPDLDLSFEGELDDIQESLDAIYVLFLFGVGLIYLILGTQFRSYFQPLMILVTLPMAFTGVVLGLLITGNPMSLFTLYGVVALAGISVNAAIVLISAANDRLAAGMSLLHATVYAARRRVIPIIITSLTTIAGLLSLATGLGGQSLLWGPVATSIVWGLSFSALMTLFAIPLLYRLTMPRSKRVGVRTETGPENRGPVLSR